MKSLMLCLICLPMLAVAQPSDTDSRRRGRRGPPPQALEACQDAHAGDACAFEGRRGAVNGACFAPDDKPLACRPDRRRKRRRTDE